MCHKNASVHVVDGGGQEWRSSISSYHPLTMEPRHPQPFTLTEARQLDVGIIVTGKSVEISLTAEISRLQNSLTHLEQTQADLLSALEEEEDTDLREAWSENQGVMYGLY